ncbi:M23 family metallopeptidase [Runella sp. MFBS21]|uniref:M23 family metallopeptidase n=1 Tax=Runella sp. MFBS21 TaxID=3034018 RepID=UPI0023F9FF5D|nr:M23 family metallopeptidase [Runella sp. MFBS21]MDF7821852.1 M23 family metallopeptidase [Runella sp. MFBS21]
MKPLFVWLVAALIGHDNSPINQEQFNELLISNRHLASRVPCVIPIDQFSEAQISSLFAYRKHPILAKIKHHNGLDIACKRQAILAAATGVVSKTGYDKGLGNYIKIIHGNGYETTYGHLSQVFVEKGQVVELCEKIGVAGKTGMATGVHLHYEIRYNGQLENPIKYLLLLYYAIGKRLDN